MQTYDAGILGASGYTGSELVRLVAAHESIHIAALTADRWAGKEAGEALPHLGELDLPRLGRIEDTDFSNLDIVFCALPHGVAQDVVPSLPSRTRIVDLSADFRIRDPSLYETWYGAAHRAPDLLGEVVYGLPEAYRADIRKARIVACTGCYVAASLTPLLPLVASGVVDAQDIIIDAKSGASGAGRTARESLSYCEVAEGCAAYGVGWHRHMAELEQELSRAAKRPLRASFTPHLMPFSRGILATIYLRGGPEEVQSRLEDAYAREPFVRVLPSGQVPRTQQVRGSNVLLIGISNDRRPGRTIVVSVLDNLIKGASGQAVQNANLMLGLPETAGLQQTPVFP